MSDSVIELFSATRTQAGVLSSILLYSFITLAYLKTDLRVALR